MKKKRLLTNFGESASAVPKDVVLRSLRRRLWQAIVSDDAHLALRVYKSTRVDWDQWYREQVAMNSHKHTTANATATLTPASTNDSQETSMGILQSEMNPSEPFLADDFLSPQDEYYDGGVVEDNKHRPRRSPRRRSRRYRPAQQAFSSFWRRNRAEEEERHVEGEENDCTRTSSSSSMTTPLHEASRLGCGELVRLMLAHCQADCNQRNGSDRTALHMVAGGGGDAIAAPVVVVTPEPSSGAMRAVHAVGRLWRRSSSRRSVAAQLTKPVRKTDTRMDAALAILSWSDSSGQGPTTNSVDCQGRTALHYAAEMGREDLCQAVLQSFGSILTIVDVAGRTPCELAAERGHKDLAAELEARAVLYMDPYGMDEDLMSSMNFLQQEQQDGFSRRVLVPPFSWFETVMDVQKERERRRDVVFDRMKKIVVLKQRKARTRAAILESAQKLEQSEKQVSSGADEEEVSNEESDDVDHEGKAKAESSNGIDRPNDSEEQQESCDDDDENLKLNSLLKDIAHTDSDNPPSDADTGAQNEGQLDSDDASGPQTEEPGGEKDSSDDSEEKDDVERFDLLYTLHKTHAELLLTVHGWDIKKALVAFFEDPFKALEEAGVTDFSNREKQSSEGITDQSENMCLICCEVFESCSNKWKELVSCDHKFCTECLSDYVANCSKSKSSGVSIICPHHECSAPLSPMEIVQLAPTTENYEALLEAANENFVVAADDFKFCPHPGCAGAVKFTPPRYRHSETFHKDIIKTVGAVCTAIGEHGTDAPLTYEGLGDPAYYQSSGSVQPRTAHRFCFQCGELGLHWPLPCQRLGEWKEEVRHHVNTVADTEGDDENYNDVAQKLWMKANTRPCPKCKAPIEKDEGCNHMTCRGCRYEFCWICLEDWKLHNSSTGGFFRCNRWVDQKDHTSYDEKSPDEAAVVAAVSLTNDDLGDPSTMSATYGTAMHESRTAARRAREVGRFLHHYRRWSAHAESAELEDRMRESACKRLSPVVRAARDFSGEGESFNFGGRGLSFVHAAFAELAECRSLLQHSYAFSFLRYRSLSEYRYRLNRGRHTEKAAFEKHQAEVETMTEQISDVVARSHLRATQTQIVFLTAAAAEKRREFSNLMATILVEEKRQEAKQTELGAYRQFKKKKKKRRSREALPPGLLDSMAIVGEERSSDEGETPGGGEMDAAVRASLEEFMVNTGEREVLNVDDNDATGDWPCEACTFVNSTGTRRCAMCGTARS